MGLIDGEKQEYEQRHYDYSLGNTNITSFLFTDHSQNFL